MIWLSWMVQSNMVVLAQEEGKQDIKQRRVQNIMKHDMGTKQEACMR